MIDVLRIAHLRIAPQEGNLEVGNCEGNQITIININMINHHYDLLLVVLGLPLNVDAHHLLLLLPLLLGLLRTTLLAIFT